MLRKGKGKEARLVFMAHALMENRHGMLVDFQATQATGTAERDIVPELLDQARERGFHPRTLGGDKGYDTRECVADLRRRGVTPHVARNTGGGPAPLTAGPPGIRGTRSARGFGNGLRRSLGG